MKLLLQSLCIILTVLCSSVQSQWSSGICLTCPANTDDRTNYDLLTKVIVAQPRENIPPCGRRPDSCFNINIRYRRIDGSCNNLFNPTWGQANTTYARLLAPVYNDGISTPRMATDKTPLAGARSIRVDMFPIGGNENPTRNINAVLFGQFVTHDMSNQKSPSVRGSCCSPTSQLNSPISQMCFPILFSANDPTQGRLGTRCKNFSRTVTDRDLGCVPSTQQAQPINEVTSYLDLSNVYGYDLAMTNSLRTFFGGLLKTEIRNNKIFPPTETGAGACACNAPGETVCYRTGDSRSNQNPQLAILQILFHREHNRLANQLRAVNPFWSDEKLFQEARRINIAQYQRITYYEWMPVMLGNTIESKGLIFPNATSFVNDYNSNIRPDVSNEHAHAAFRYFHTHIAGLLRFMSEQRVTTSTDSISNWISRPGILERNNGIDELTVGMISQNSQTTDNLFVEEMVDKLFACRGSGFGTDLKALDIQRDRDHGLGYYNDYRRICGLKVATSFEDYGDLLGAQTIASLKKFYKSFRDVDLSVAGSLETLHPGGAQVGQTFHCIITNQFLRTRRGDRYWFENSDSGLSHEQLIEVRKATMARIFCDNGNGISRVQANAFLTVAANGGTLLNCSSIPSIDFNKWNQSFLAWILENLLVNLG